MMKEITILSLLATSTFGSLLYAGETAREYSSKHRMGRLKSCLSYPQCNLFPWSQYSEEYSLCELREFLTKKLAPAFIRS
jgi:hypothetical protein